MLAQCRANRFSVRLDQLALRQSCFDSSIASQRRRSRCSAWHRAAGVSFGSPATRVGIASAESGCRVAGVQKALVVTRLMFTRTIKASGLRDVQSREGDIAGRRSAPGANRRLRAG